MWEAVDIIPSKAEWESALRARCGDALYERFSAAHVAVCGLGGLGSNIAVSLARAGVGRLLLIDFDRVDVANLHRQQYKACQTGLYKTEALKAHLAEICPYTRVDTVCERLTRDNAPALLSQVDIICEAFDKAESKAMLADVFAESLRGKYLVSASGMAGLGSPNGIKTKRAANRFYICGDGVCGTDGGMRIFAPRVMLCAAHQAQTVLRILAGEEQ